MNSAFAVVFTLVLAAVVLIIVLLSILVKNNRKVQNLYRLMKKKLFWSVLIRSKLEHFLMLSIAYSIKMRALSKHNFEGAALSAYSIGVVMLLIITPFLTRHFLNRRFENGEIQTPEFYVKYSPWLLHVDFDRKPALLSTVIFMLRRIGLAIIIVFFSSMNWLQRQLIIALCTATLAYTLAVRPFREGFHNALEVCNEMLILLNSYFMILYSNFIVDDHTRYVTGWANIVVMTALVLVNVLVMSTI